MAIREKSAVLGDIRRRTGVKKGKAYHTFEVYYGTDRRGRKIRRYYRSEKTARAEVAKFFMGLRNSGEGVSELRPSEIYDAQDALRLLRRHKVDLSLTDVARAFVEQRESAGVTPKPLAEAYAEYLASIPAIQGLHRGAVEGRVGRWVSHVGANVMCSDIQARDIAQYLTSFNGHAVRTWNNHMGYIKTFCGWMCRKERRYMASNPMSDMSKRKIAYRTPAFMRAGDFEKVIRALERDEGKRHLLGYVTLSYFCGIRTEEIKRLAENVNDIRPDEGTVIIRQPKGFTQGATPRPVHIPGNAVEWMRRIDFKAALTTDMSRIVCEFGSFAARLGVRVGRNFGRHTCATMHVAAFADTHKTEAMLGTSSSMRVKHYMGLVTRAEGEWYFGLLPSGLGQEDKKTQG